jgi:hypothetical protein
MAWHNSSDWLHVFHDETDWYIACGEGLSRVIRSLADPHTQYPSTVLLVGKHEKDAAQRAMFSGLDCFKPRGLAQLHVDASTIDDEHPLLIASLDIETAYSNFRPPRKSFPGTGHRVEWLCGQPLLNAAESLVDTVISRLLLLFTDVVCLFVDDFPNPLEVFSLIQRWTGMTQSRRPWNPRVILVTHGPMDSSILRTLTLGEVQHVRLNAYSKKLRRSCRHRALKNVIVQSIEVVQERKIACKRLFSARHIDNLFRLGLQHVASQALPEFDTIPATRQINKIDKHFPHHLRTFLKLCSANHASKDFILRYVASALILDSLPPGMHRRYSL